MENYYKFELKMVVIYPLILHYIYLHQMLVLPSHKIIKKSPTNSKEKKIKKCPKK